MITLFHAPWTRSLRILWLLEELGADYEVRQVDLYRAQSGTGGRDPSNPHPDGKVPALMHDNALVTESAAIALYLTDLHSESPLGVQVGSPERAAYLTWLFWAIAELEPVVWAKMEGRTETDSELRRRYEFAFNRIFSALEHGDHMLGGRFTSVDVLVAGALGWARKHAPESAALDAYLERAAARPAYAKASTKDDMPRDGSSAH